MWDVWDIKPWSKLRLKNGLQWSALRGITPLGQNLRWKVEWNGLQWEKFWGISRSQNWNLRFARKRCDVRMDCNGRTLVEIQTCGNWVKRVRCKGLHWRDFWGVTPWPNCHVIVGCNVKIFWVLPWPKLRCKSELQGAALGGILRNCSRWPKLWCKFGLNWAGLEGHLSNRADKWCETV